MEVADQWRREWAGTAEFGKVVEGGVTRQIARAMEVLHASGPNAKVRVMRAAYHSTAGPGFPASSYMVHSSRRVISSGFNLMDTPSLPSKPLEISSIPLELSQDYNTDTENYKVTEPDDFEISEPSKWKSSLSGFRMPSEESSSTDNASIIDLDPKPHKPFYRKQSYDSETSDIPLSSGRNSRTSPLLDAPVTLSTLKFKSLLNGNNDWNSRRKSYSFEDTSPLSETILHSNDTLAMESSTDSGICKSTELVNDNTDDNATSKYFKVKDNFQNWMANNKQNNYYKGTKYKNYRDHDIVEEDPSENITLQSTGKVSITLPMAIETEDGIVYRNGHIEENNRKIKKVEFCKTELHFAAETGKVNIISTDSKPPPSNDFRKRRSAFVPMREMLEKPITLFGEKINDFTDVNKDSLNYSFSEYNESDENTAATKSILKNKIPKPKPYLLGENMAFGTQNDENYDSSDSTSVPTGVSLINKQLQPDGHIVSPKPLRPNVSSLSHNTFRTISEGPNEISSKHDIYSYRRERNQKTVRLHDEENTVNSMKNIQPIKRSPTPGRLKSRELRESDLTYFGINSLESGADGNHTSNKAQRITNTAESDLFQSVKLIKQVSSSVCNSESEDTPEYQNIPFNKNYVPTPTPRPRTRFTDKPNQIDEIKVLRPVIEQERESKYDDMTISRRSKLRRQEEFNSLKNRSRSEPRKSYDMNSIERSRKADQPARSTESTIKSNKNIKINKQKSTSDDETPIYENVADFISSNYKPLNTNSTSRSYKNNKRVTEKDTNITKSQKMNQRKTDSINSQEKQNANTRKTKDDEIKYITLQVKTHDGKKDIANSIKKPDHIKNSQDNSSDLSKQKNKSLEHRKRNKSSTRNEEKDPRHVQRASGGANTLESVRPQKKESTKTKTLSDSEKDTDFKYNNIKTELPQIKENTHQDSLKMIPRVVPIPAKNKSMGNKDTPRPGGRSKRSEYVINYDDKNGTVSSVTKVRSTSGSPRRKPSRDMPRDKYKDSLQRKTAEKVALLQPEDHQRYAGSPTGNTKWKSKVHAQRSCQVL